MEYKRFGSRMVLRMSLIHICASGVYVARHIAESL